MRFGTPTSGMPFLEGGGLERSRAWHFKMKDESNSPSRGTRQAEQALSAGLAALSSVTFSDSVQVLTLVISLFHKHPKTTRSDDRPTVHHLS